MTRFSWKNSAAYRTYGGPSVICPACGSPPGRPCFGGGWMRQPHGQRVRLASEREAELRGFLLGAAAGGVL